MISETTLKELKNILKSSKIIDILIKKLKNKNIENIYLERPFVKIKVSLFDFNLRIIWEYRKINWILVLILIFKKSDKKYWNNLIWANQIENLTKNMLIKITKDIKEWKYNIY